ncbi:hypothetical protein DCS_06073 [Drechmeria coniospora]|uniref:Urea amidolyase n=1 Tax=Drechmeria coniospora TaxID=98403 RepID=A0A151GAJ3_DRECN|nr:hypothetical protein DCS_06073 [Drechmeria coniospora]KYK54116.1 hypothetical protein DCS_06073 [Drechmeria coniospora]
MAPFIEAKGRAGPHHASAAGQQGASGESQRRVLVAIEDWRTAQLQGRGLQRILSLIEEEKETNAKTHAWIAFASPEQVREQWDRLERQSSFDPSRMPLFGVPFAVKDNIDLAGFPTTAACPMFASSPAASDAPVVARLKAAGAIVVGKTNMDQFATGLVGTRSPHGAVPNSFDEARVSGGSSSGSGVVVARCAVPFSLGTDTAGSGRVPAGFNNCVGLKPTRGALSTRGVLPACRTLDCVSIFTLTVADAKTVLDVAEAYDPDDAYSRRRPEPHYPLSVPAFGVASVEDRPPRLAICDHPDWHGRDDHYPAYEAALKKAADLGWDLVPVDFSQLFALAKLLYDGPWVAERYAAIKDFIDQAAHGVMDPTVREIISRAKAFSAADAFASEYARQDLAREISNAFESFDGLLVPTTPTFPTQAQVARDPIRENSLLGTYTNFVNFLDWTAIAIPAGFRPDGLPFSVTLISNSWQESTLFRLSQKWFADGPRLLGASGICRKADGDPAADIDSRRWTAVAVVGAHLTGFPLNKDLVSRGGQFAYSTTTSRQYRLYKLCSASGPEKPGLERVASPNKGRQIALEVWRLPSQALPDFMTTIPPPLGIGSIELYDGSWVPGFICEPIGLQGAQDITKFGGWRAYSRHMEAHSACNGVCTQASEQSCRAVKKISKVLIANRGEIAARIIRTLRKMSIDAVSIYAEPDAAAPHVREADVSLPLCGDSVAETYLNGAQILQLAKSAGADAIIPGYGFLSENADFAKSVEAEGMIFVGPTAEQIDNLGLKHRARALAASSGVPIIPGSSTLLTSLDDAREEAKRIGFPLMLKSTAGGGGIGLRRCNDIEELDDAFNAVQRLAAANFGDSGIFIERFIENARHIEVQIIGDGKGRVVTVGERDCSLQRRHQKVIEECPAFAIAEHIRQGIHAAAVRLASAVKYRNVGTIEFIYDVDSQDYFFLEANTRLQVEHPVTEAVTGLDLVECMLKVAGDNCDELFEAGRVTLEGASIEVRLYAENPLQRFRPCSGTVKNLTFPSNLRVDTWIDVGTEVSTRYDPLLAKLIATGKDRHEALERLAAGLDEAQIEGVQTNLEYLRKIVAWSLFQSGGYTTKSLDVFQFHSNSFEVLEQGAMTTIQDYPGRVSYWHIGVPPSGPMDHLSFRLANRLVSNDADAAAMECTFQGPTLRFHCDVIAALTGAKAETTLDDEPVAFNQAFVIRAGQTLRVGSVESGYRVYIAVAGGVDVPKVMGSRATFEVGALGHGKLQAGQIIPLGSSQHCKSPAGNLPQSPAVPIPEQPNASWTIGVIPGPHGAPEYFTDDGLETLFSGEWKVHHNSNRLGVRLTGPRPKWARQSGGQAGLHPSNIHDTPYSIGSISFTGDEAVVLTCDGPSLGGFVVFCVVATAELWKLGQVRPGDSIRLHAMDTSTAYRLERELDSAIQDLREPPNLEEFCLSAGPVDIFGAIIGKIGSSKDKIVARQAGDHAMVLEFGESEGFDMRHSFKIHAFCQNHIQNPVGGFEELTPGVRTVHMMYSSGLTPKSVLDRISRHVSSYSTPTKVPSRMIFLPLAFDDSVSKAAVQRYASTIRSTAPWLPSNIAFLEELNGIDDVSELLYDATFLVLGLGDVFLGSPCAVPLDPRHRLFGTKYNPSRSFTPRGSVGIGGQYMCIYAANSPGGYQLVGRTIDIWDSGAVPTGAGKTGANPWMFQPFDRISFYRVRESELDGKPAEQLIRIADGSLDLEEYEAWVASNKDDIEQVAARRQESISSAPFLPELCAPYRPSKVHNGGPSGSSTLPNLGGESVRAMMPGHCYNFRVREKETVQRGEVLVSGVEVLCSQQHR